MHISLDSALGRQRRLNSVGESALQIAPNAAAAYSLRSLTGGDPKVVRVRRASDNHEQDFTASEVSSGALTSFVNAQVTPPLDIQALSATGRDGDFLIAKAAYSLRSLGTRQATLAATGDTVARADGKYVCQVRRSSDDGVKSFTATEVTDGTLLAFTNADYAKYTSDFSSGDDSWGSFDDVTETGNIDGIGGLDNNLRLAIGTATSGHRAFRSSTLPVGQKINFSARVFVPSTNSDVDGILIRDANGTVIVATTAPTQDEWVTVTANDVTPINAQLRVNLQKGAASSFTGNGSDEVYLREITVTQVTSDGFVKTWYDQSVTNQAGDTATGNHAIQGTAGSQPKIVSAGSLVTGGLRFDDAQKLETAGTFSFASGTTLSTFITNKSDGDENAYLFRFVSDYIVYNTAGGDRRVFAGTNAVSGTLGSDEELWTTISALNSSGGTANFFADGTLVSSADANIGTNTVSNRVLNIGGSGSTTHWNGTVNEVIFYDTDQTDNRIAIEANIGEVYNINLPAGVDPLNNEVDGFVETWYDQSGNNRPLIQTTASEQPLIVEAGTFLNGVKSNQATSNDTMQNLQVSTDGTNADFGTDDWENGEGSKLGAVYVGTVPADSVADPVQNAIIWGGGRGVSSFQLGSVALTVVKAGADNWKIRNERQGLSPSGTENTTSLNTDADVVLYGTTDNREFTINVNGSGDTETVSADLDVRSGTALSLFGAYDGNANRYYQRSSGGVCKECYLYAGDSVANIPALATSINSHYSIY